MRRDVIVPGESIPLLLVWCVLLYHQYIPEAFFCSGFLGRSGASNCCVVVKDLLIIDICTSIVLG